MLAAHVVLWATRNMESNPMLEEVWRIKDECAREAELERSRFPADFMFQLTLDEAQTCAASRFQFGTLKRGQNIKRLPQVFTQEAHAANRLLARARLR
jgi:ORF6N domain